MKLILLEEKKNDALIDFKDNIERLRKIRNLNIKNLYKIRNLKKDNIYSA